MTFGAAISSISAQLVRAVPDDARSLLDIGSGAGFPGMVLALLGAGDVHLVEADGRKCQFLREVAARDRNSRDHP